MTIEQLAVGNAIAFAALGWFLKAFLTHLLAKDLERERQALLKGVESHKLALSREVKEFEQRLQLAASIRQTTFTALHEKRAAILADLYSKAQQILVEARKYVKPEFKEYTTAKQFVVAMSAVLQLRDFMNANRLYLPKPVANAIDGLVDQFGDGIVDFERKANTLLTEDEQKSFFLYQAELKQIVDTDAAETLQLIEDAFRMLLGVVDDA